MSLHQLQSRVHVAKDKKNDFGGYNYRTAEGILAAAKAALPDGANILVTDDMRELAGQIFVQSIATVTFADGTSHSASGFAMHPLTKKGMDPSQITGSASSYARKYALGGLLALDDGSADPDASKKPYEEDKEPEPTFEHRQQADFILSLIDKCKTQQHLQDVWTGNGQTIFRIKTDKPPMYAELVKEKDAAKARLHDDPARQAPPVDA